MGSSFRRKRFLFFACVKQYYDRVTSGSSEESHACQRISKRPYDEPNSQTLVASDVTWFFSFFRDEKKMTRS